MTFNSRCHAMMSIGHYVEQPCHLIVCDHARQHYKSANSHITVHLKEDSGNSKYEILSMACV